MKTPADKAITFTIVSHPTRDKAMRWAVNIAFPMGADEKTLIPVVAEDGNGNPVKKAVFEFAGRAIDIADGKGSLSYADFISGKHEKGIWLKRSGANPVPGSLTFA